MQVDPVPDGRTQDVLGLAHQLNSANQFRRSLVAAIDRLEPAWTQVVLRLDGPTLAALSRQCDDLTLDESAAGDELATVTAVASLLARHYSLPAIPVAVLAVALALTADLDRPARIEAADVIADAFGSGTFENLDAVFEGGPCGPDEGIGTAFADASDPGGEFFITTTRFGQAIGNLAGGLFTWVRVPVVLLMSLAALITEHFWLIPLTLSAWLVMRHPFDIPQTTQTAGPVGRRVATSTVSWHAILAIIFAALGWGGLAMFTVLLFVTLELIAGIGELVEFRTIHVATKPAHPFSRNVTRFPGRVAQYEAGIRLARYVLADGFAVLGVVMLRLLHGTVLVTVLALVLLGTVMLGRSRIIHSILLFGAAAYLDGSLDILIGPLCVGLVCAAILGWLQRMPDSPVPIPKPSRISTLTADGRHLLRVHRLLRKNRPYDALHALAGRTVGKPAAAETASLMAGWAHLKDERPEAALATVTRIGDIDHDSDTVHRRVIRAVIEVNARLDLIDPIGATAAAQTLVEYRSQPRCHIDILRHGLLAEARRMVESEAPDDQVPAHRVELADMLGAVVPTFVTNSRILLTSELIGRTAECAVGVHNVFASGLLAIRFTTIGTTASGIATDFDEAHCLEPQDDGGDDAPEIAEAELNTLRERWLGVRGWALLKKTPPEFGPLSTPASRRLTATLDQYGDAFREVHRGRRSVLSDQEGFLTGLRKFDGNDFSDGNMSLLRSIIKDARDTPALTDNPLAGRVLAILGRNYVRFADYGTAAEAFARSSMAHRSGSDAERVRSWACAVFATLQSEIDPADLKPFEFTVKSGSLHDFQRAVQRVRDHVNAGRFDQPEALRKDLLVIRRHSVLAYALALKPISTLLRGAGQTARAVTVLEDALNWIRDNTNDAWLMSLPQEELADLTRSQRPDTAMTLALAAWNSRELAIYTGCSERMRWLAWEGFARVRDLAMDSAVRTADFGTLASLIERARTEGMLVTTMERQVRSWSTTVKVRVDGDVEDRPMFSIPGDLDPNCPKAVGLAIEDAIAATTVVRRPGDTLMDSLAGPLAGGDTPAIQSETTVRIVEQLDRMDTDHFLSFHIENNRIYWAYCGRTREFTGGVLDLKDHRDLANVLEQLSLHAMDEPTTVVDDMASYGSPRESAITRPLGKLCADTVAAALTAGDGTRLPTLALAFSPELSTVPWPVIPVGGRRLLEVATLRVWSTAGIESRRPPLVNVADNLELGLCCDDPTGDLQSEKLDFASFFRHYLSSSESDGATVATRDNVMEALKEMRRDPRPALAFFRTHSTQEHDPAYSILRLADDEAIQAGELYGSIGNGEHFIPMPYRVVLSSCSSATTMSRGGSSMGLATGCIASGAVGVVATGVDVYDSTFTQDLDHRLIRTMRMPQRHDILLSNLYRELFAEWRDRGADHADYSVDIPHSHPVVWAYYWAF